MLFRSEFALRSVEVRFASLGSGSEGNGLIVQAGSTTLLLDCGFGLAETERRLARLRLTPDTLTAIAVTHEHDDHVGGVARFARRHEIPVFLTHGTLMATGVSRFEGIEINVIDSHAAVAVGEGTQFVVINHQVKSTDTGYNALAIPSVKVQINDDDKDGVSNNKDKCPGTPAGA